MLYFDLGDDSLLALEQKLKAELNPVQPDDEFVNNLKRHLEKSVFDQQRRTKAAKLLLVAVGMSAGFAIFLIGRNFIRVNEEN